MCIDSLLQTQPRKYTHKHTQVQHVFNILLAGRQDYIYSLLSGTWLWVQQSRFGTAGADMTLQDVLGCLSHTTLCVCARVFL